MLEIIPICLNIVTIGLTIYELFWKNTSDNVSQYIQNNIILQINPNYNMEMQSNYAIDKIDSIDLQNARWKSKRIMLFALFLIYASMGTNFIKYFTTHTINSLMDIVATFYIPLRNTMIQLSITIIILCIIIVIRGWNKKQNILNNFINMKYFTLKVFSDSLLIINFLLVDYHFLEKINKDMQNPIYSSVLMMWVMSLLFQILWIQFTVSKLNKIVPIAITYEEKEKQIFSFVPVYILSLLLFGLTVYTKFF